MDFQYITHDFQEKILTAAHHIHRNPELSEQEFMTTGYILDVLESLNIELTEVQPNTGVIGLIRGGKPGPTVALRADIDALPVEEAADHAIRSERPGIMHACGHDTHTAALLGAAMALAANKEQLQGNVLLIFQPAEECTTGAQAVMDTGVFEEHKPVAFLSLHMMPSIPEGKVGIRTGPIMAAQKGFTITFSGKGGHGAFPHTAIDPVITAMRTAEALQSIPAQWADPIQPFVLTICSIHGGKLHNSIPESVEMLGSIRAYSNHNRAHAKQRLVEICEGMAKLFRGSCEVEFLSGVASLHCEPALARELAGYIGQIATKMEELPKQMGSEDFAEVTQKVPSVFMGIGAGGEDEIYHRAGSHHPKIVWNEDVIPLGAAVHAGCAANWLLNHAE